MKFVMLFIIDSTDHNKILHMSQIQTSVKIYSAQF